MGESEVVLEEEEEENPPTRDIGKCLFDFWMKKKVRRRCEEGLEVEQIKILLLLRNTTRGGERETFFGHVLKRPPLCADGSSATTTKASFHCSLLDDKREGRKTTAFLLPIKGLNHVNVSFY